MEKTNNSMGARRQWVFASPVPDQIKVSFPEFDPLILQLLYNRGLSEQSAIDEFLEPDYGSDIHDPMLFRDMEKAVTRIIKAIDTKQRIVVYGDYDADGVCGAALLVETIREIGGNPGVYIPYRQTEGYGLNISALNDLKQEGNSLLITDDCGVMNWAEVEQARKIGLDIIITDHHHEPEKLPRALAIISPSIKGETYPFKELAGAGVAFKLACALLKRTDYGRMFKRALPAGWEKWLLDLVAIATVADMVPLRGENRTLVTYGLKVLRKTKRAGLQCLFNRMGLARESADTETIAYGIAPRLNSAGRLDHANAAFRLIITDDQAEAETIADDLQRTNSKRQQLTEAVVAEAKEQIKEPGDRMILAAFKEDWPSGVLGLAAGRLTQTYNRPVYIATKVNGEIVGSARSIPSFDVIETFERHRSCFSKLGGHAQACGFTFVDEEQYAKFKELIEAEARVALAGESLIPNLFIDAKIGLADINWGLLDQIERLAPFGQQVKRPVFAVTDVRVVEASAVGRAAQHLRLTVSSDDGAIRRTIGFSLAEELPKLPIGRRLALACELGADEWNGERRLQLKLHDVKYE